MRLRRACFAFGSASCWPGIEDPMVCSAPRPLAHTTLHPEHHQGLPPPRFETPPVHAQTGRTLILELDLKLDLAKFDAAELLRDVRAEVGDVERTVRQIAERASADLG